MPDYAEMYKRLFRSQTQAIDILQQAQRDTEDMYIESETPNIRVLERKESATGENGPEKEDE